MTICCASTPLKKVTVVDQISLLVVTPPPKYRSTTGALLWVLSFWKMSSLILIGVPSPYPPRRLYFKAWGDFPFATVWLLHGGMFMNGRNSRYSLPVSCLCDEENFVCWKFYWHLVDAASDDLLECLLFTLYTQCPEIWMICVAPSTAVVNK